MSVLRISEKFLIDRSAIKSYRSIPVEFGFNGVGEMTYYRSYSRIKANTPDGEPEEQEVWWETIERIVNGVFSIMKTHIVASGIEWSDKKGQKLALEMYDTFFHMRGLPPGRGLANMGTNVTDSGRMMALFNCAAVSTEGLGQMAHPTRPFEFLMSCLMAGVGVGVDVMGAGSLDIPNKHPDTFTVEVQDTSDSWVEAMAALLNAYFTGAPRPVFDTSRIRPEGTPLKTMGGVCPGPLPLIELEDRLNEFLTNNCGAPITSTTLADIINMIGKCSGAGRRAAELLVGRADDQAFLDLKKNICPGEANERRAPFAFLSNNSVVGDDLTREQIEAISENIVHNGEPGILFLENMRKYGRMNDLEHPDWKDRKARLCNPCCEVSLESYELCNLNENFLNNIETKEEFLRTLKSTYLYSKVVTLCQTPFPETNRIILRNRRIGCSLSGVAQFVEKRSPSELMEWCTAGYRELQRLDQVYSDWFGIPRSIKMTSIKPSGSVSLLAGATPGVHYPVSGDCYIRRIAINRTSPLADEYRMRGHVVEPKNNDEANLIVEFNVKMDETMRSESEVSMWERTEIPAICQEYWADLMVSYTCAFDIEDEGKDIPRLIAYYRRRLKCISFLPKYKGAVQGFTQLPYESISRDQWVIRQAEQVERARKWADEHDQGPGPGRMKIGSTDHIEEKYCDGDSCLL